MRYGVLGTGAVGRELAGALVRCGHEVTMGSRSAGNGDARHWADGAGENASVGTFAEAAERGERILNCTAGAHSLEALELAGPGRLEGKLLIDVANPLDFSAGMPPRLHYVNDTSLAEQIQAAHPGARVVKTLNTVNAGVMTDPAGVPGNHVVFVSGDDDSAKRETVAILVELGWEPDRVLDLGGIETARGTEMYLPLWISLMSSLGTARFNISIER